METYLWHEQPSYKNLYETEVNILKQGLNGIFRLYEDVSIDNNRVLAIGELVFGENQKQGVAIVFPTKYPYAPPDIIAIQVHFDPAGKLIKPLSPSLFGKGNQYINGKLCLFPKSFWNPIDHNIGWMLKRSQDWLKSATSKEGFKPEDIIEESPFLLRPVGQVLLPKKFDPPNNVKSGFLSFTHFKTNHYILEQNILPSSVFPRGLKDEVFKWYAFGGGLTLKGILANSNVQNLITLIQNTFGENFSEGEPIKNIAIYLPEDKNPWHFFKFVNQNNGVLLIQYYTTRIISDELYLRTKDIFDNVILLKKRATIIGLGALGSEVAKSLAKNGVGHFNIFDPDTFEIGNSIRHAADLFYIGENKVNVVKQLILRSNPNITVNAYTADVLNDNGLLEKSLNESDICICLTAEESVDYLINDHYVKKYNIPFIFARVSAGAFSGAVQIVNKESACLRCLSLYRLDTLPEPRSKIEFEELKPEYGSCSEPPLPGSEIDAKEISLMVSRIAMQCLLQEESSIYPKLTSNLFYWHGPFGSEDKAPFTWEMKNQPKHPDCTTCQ